MYKLWVALSKNVTEIWNIYFITSFPGSRRARKTNIVNFFSEASQRSGILNPWIWLANSARSSVRIFPSGPRVRIALPRASVASSVQAPPTLRRRIWKRKFHSETQRRWNWKRNNHRLIWIWVSKKKKHSGKEITWSLWRHRIQISPVWKLRCRDGMVWAIGLTVKLKLRFQIYPR